MTCYKFKYDVKVTKKQLCIVLVTKFLVDMNYLLIILHNLSLSTTHVYILLNKFFYIQMNTDHKTIARNRIIHKTID